MMTAITTLPQKKRDLPAFCSSSSESLAAWSNPEESAITTQVNPKVHIGVFFNAHINQYVFCYNNPVKWRDPMGLDIRWERGNQGGMGGCLNDSIHEYISVDIYDVNGNVVGEASFSFGSVPLFGRIPTPLGRPYMQAYRYLDTGEGFQDGKVIKTITLTPEETNEWYAKLYNATQGYGRAGLYPIENCIPWTRGTIRTIERWKEDRDKKNQPAEK